MNAQKLKAVIFILVFLLILALIITWATGCDADRRAQEPEETQETEQTQPTPEPPQDTPVPAQQPTVPTVPTPKPENQPTQPSQPSQPTQTTAPTVPTPVPTPTPLPSGQLLGSGSFHSETGTGLNLICDWKAVSVEGNKAEITLTVSAESYSLHLSDMGNNVFISVGGQPAEMAQPQMAHDGGYTVTTFGTRTFTLPLNEGTNNFSVAVEWHFNGSYSGTPLDVIECGTTITLTR